METSIRRLPPRILGKALTDTYSCLIGSPYHLQQNPRGNNFQIDIHALIKRLPRSAVFHAESDGTKLKDFN